MPDAAAPTSPQLELLRALLLGEHITTVTVANWWTLGTSRDHFLVAQEISAPDADVTRTALQAGPVDLLAGAVDPEDITTAVTVLRCVRRSITAVSLSDDGSLTLAVEGGGEFCLRTDTDIVDWHWAINETGQDPYRSLLVGCVTPGLVETG